MRIAKRLILALAALVLLLCALSSAFAQMEPGSEFDSTVLVEFTEKIYFAELGAEGMDIDFGTHPLPLGETYIPSTGDSHTLRVCDGRVAAGRWRVDAAMTNMISGGDSFEAVLRLYHPDQVTGLDFTYTQPNEFLQVTTTSGNIITAGSVLPQGNYDLHCVAANTRLLIPSGTDLLVKARAYKSTVTWTLTLDVP